MKKLYLLGFIAAFVLCACDNSEDLPPRMEDLNNDAIIIPTTRLTYEEKDLIKGMWVEYDKAVAEMAQQND